MWSPKLPKLPFLLLLNISQNLNILIIFHGIMNWSCLVVMSGLIAPGYFVMYGKHLKLGIPLPLPPFITNILQFFESYFGQVHPLFSWALVGFMIICHALGIPTSATIFRRYYKVRATEINSGWFTCALNVIWAYFPSLLLLSLGRIRFSLSALQIFLLRVPGLPVKLFLIWR